MPSVNSRPTNIIIQQGNDGVGKLLITLELNINLNANGSLEASVGAATDTRKKFVEDDEPIVHEVPDFSKKRNRVEFGKDVVD